MYFWIQWVWMGSEKRLHAMNELNFYINPILSISTHFRSMHLAQFDSVKIRPIFYPNRFPSLSFFLCICLRNEQSECFSVPTLLKPACDVCYNGKPLTMPHRMHIFGFTRENGRDWNVKVQFPVSFNWSWMLHVKRGYNELLSTDAFIGKYRFAVYMV